MLGSIQVFVSHGRKAVDYGIFDISNNDDFDTMLNHLDSIKGYKRGRFWLSSLNFLAVSSDEKVNVTSGTHIAINRSQVRDLEDFITKTSVAILSPISHGGVFFENRTGAMAMYDAFPVRFLESHMNNYVLVLCRGTFVSPTDAKILFPGMTPWLTERAVVDGNDTMAVQNYINVNWELLPFRWCELDRYLTVL